MSWHWVNLLPAHYPSRPKLTVITVLHPYYKLNYIEMAWGGAKEQAEEIEAGNESAIDWQDEARQVVERVVSHIPFRLQPNGLTSLQYRWKSITDADQGLDLRFLFRHQWLQMWQALAPPSCPSSIDFARSALRGTVTKGGPRSYSGT